MQLCASRSWAVILLACSGVFAASGAWATPEQAGYVVVSDGTVADTGSDGSQRQLKDGDLVYSGDTLSTGGDGYLDIDFIDGSRILLHPGTQFQIAQYHFEPVAHD